MYQDMFAIKYMRKYVYNKLQTSRSIFETVSVTTADDERAVWHTDLVKPTPYVQEYIFTFKVSNAYFWLFRSWTMYKKEQSC